MSEKGSVLVVEDDTAIREDLVMILESEGYSVIAAVNGADALRVLRSGVLPFVILLDIMMPVMDGWKFREQQTLDPLLAQVPVVVMTADGSASDKAKRMNAQGFLQKPMDIDLLLSSVAKFAKE